MNRSEAIAALKAGKSLELASKDATGQHWTYKPVWLGDDGDLEMSHPTRDRGYAQIENAQLHALRLA